MILVSLKDGKKITLDSGLGLDVTPNNANLSNHESNSSITTYSITNESDNSFNMENTSDDDDDDDSGSVGTSVQPKQKRQRLTHLTYEEKLQRRKLKNRIAAQSARDRKKSKFEHLEESVRLLKQQNEQLRIENMLLKEKTQLLVQENRKLLEFKKLSLSTIASEKSSIEPAVKLDEEGNACQKRKLVSTQEYGLVEVKSAVFNNIVSQPQKQFQSNIILKLISVLIVYTMSLIRQTVMVASVKNCPNSSQAYSQKLAKLRATLVKLVKLLKKLDNRNVLLNRITHLVTQMDGKIPSKASLMLLMSLLMKMKRQ
jgi:hypothetical protein